MVKKENRCPISENKVKLIENPSLQSEIYAGQAKLNRTRKIKNTFYFIILFAIFATLTAWLYITQILIFEDEWGLIFFPFFIFLFLYDFLKGKPKIYEKNGCKYEKISDYELKAYREYKEIIIIEAKKKHKEEEERIRKHQEQRKEEKIALEQVRKNRNINEQFQQIKQEQQKQQEAENEKNRQYLENLHKRANNPGNQNQETKQKPEEKIKKDRNQLYKEQKEKAYKDFSFLKPTHGNQTEIRNAIKGYDSQYLNFLLEHQMPNKDIIYARECMSHKTNANYNYEHAYIFTLGTEKKHYIVYENINDRSTTTILNTLYKTEDNSEEKYYDIIAAMKEYMGSKTENKRQWFHSYPYIKKNIRGRSVEIKINLLQHRDFDQWKCNFWDAPFYKK